MGKERVIDLMETSSSVTKSYNTVGINVKREGRGLRAVLHHRRLMAKLYWIQSFSLLHELDSSKINTLQKLYVHNMRSWLWTWWDWTVNNADFVIFRSIGLSKSVHMKSWQFRNLLSMVTCRLTISCYCSLRSKQVSAKLFQMLIYWLKQLAARGNGPCPLLAACN